MKSKQDIKKVTEFYSLYIALLQKQFEKQEEYLLLNEFFYLTYLSIITGCFNEKSEYYHQNHIGSTAMLTDNDGNVRLSLMYKPYGDLFNAAGTPTSKVERYFTGQVYDQESGLYYYNARYYDATLAAFVTPDPMMDGANHYAYANCNPVMYNDPTGLTPDYRPGTTFDNEEEGTNQPTGGEDSGIRNWTNNGDGSYTAGQGATLYGLQLISGNDYTTGSYQGTPENLPVGQTVWFFGNYSIATVVNPSGDYAPSGTRSLTNTDNTIRDIFINAPGTVGPLSLKQVGEVSMILRNDTYNPFTNTYYGTKEDQDARWDFFMLISSLYTSFLAGLGPAATQGTKTFAQQMTSEESARYQQFWNNLTKRAPEQSSPYNIIPKYTEDGFLKSVTTYDGIGNRVYQYEFNFARHGEHYHFYDNTEINMGSGKGGRFGPFTY